MTTQQPIKLGANAWMIGQHKKPIAMGFFFVALLGKERSNAYDYFITHTSFKLFNSVWISKFISSKPLKVERGTNKNDRFIYRWSV